ncbi:MAG TPA: hypothetical protein VH394_21640 [Thermoanaerobaculia bacterium]|nr:hypothetical protein [Thermoanaerobaculia bacterium]
MRRPVAVAAGLLLVAALAYGVLIPWLGYYWDDWLVFSRGLSFDAVAHQDRPLLWEARELTGLALGARPLGWHLLALVARWLTAVACWALLDGLWPARRRETVMAALLFLVYPGFSGQPLGAIYGHILLQLALHLASFAVMVHGLRRPNLIVPSIVLSAALLAGSLALSEYFVGLELLRPLLIWMTLKDSPRKAVLRWSPYLAVLSAYLVWRLFFFAAPARYDTGSVASAFLNHPIAALAGRARIALADLVRLVPMAWARVLEPDALPVGWESPRAVLLAWGIAGLAALASGVLLFRQREDPDTAWAREGLLLGLAAVCLGQLPFWLSGREVRLGTLFDRYALPAAFGSALVVTGLIAGLLRTPRQQAACAMVLVGLAAGLHVRNANGYRHDWEAQKSFFWQLSRRLPEVGCGARLRVSLGGQAMAYTADHALAVPVNWMYPGHRGDCEIRVGAAAGDGIVIDYRPPACLRVLGAAKRTGGPRAAVPVEVFGKEPVEDGCYRGREGEQ